MILVLREAQISPKITGPNNGEVDNKAEKTTLTLRGPLQHYKLVKIHVSAKKYARTDISSCWRSSSLLACLLRDLRHGVQQNSAVAVEYSSEKHNYNYFKPICQFLDMKAS